MERNTNGNTRNWAPLATLFGTWKQEVMYRHSTDLVPSQLTWLLLSWLDSFSTDLAPSQLTWWAPSQLTLTEIKWISMTVPANRNTTCLAQITLQKQWCISALCQEWKQCVIWGTEDICCGIWSRMSLAFWSSELATAPERKANYSSLQLYLNVWWTIQPPQIGI